MATLRSGIGIGSALLGFWMAIRETNTTSSSLSAEGCRWTRHSNPELSPPFASAGTARVRGGLADMPPRYLRSYTVRLCLAPAGAVGERAQGGFQCPPARSRTPQSSSDSARCAAPLPPPSYPDRLARLRADSTRSPPHTAPPPSPAFACGEGCAAAGRHLPRSASACAMCDVRWAMGGTIPIHVDGAARGQRRVLLVGQWAVMPPFAGERFSFEFSASFIPRLFSGVYGGCFAPLCWPWSSPKQRTLACPHVAPNSARPFLVPATNIAPRVFRVLNPILRLTLM
ncbi:hypothetical protein FB451DRAFT_1569279 [Mycena latifolia]|nr:hypothetical protein FB451DRAFT_1569279 [Mycena latifolia]